MPHITSAVPKARFCNLPTAAFIVWTLAIGLAACSGVQTASDDEIEESYLEFDVEPADAEIYLDDDYQGSVDGWHEQVMPIEAGSRRLELSADGYISQRFDIDVNPGRWFTLRVRLEPAVEAPDPDEPLDEDGDDEPLQAPSHPTAPDS